MSVKEKLIACALGASFVLAILLTYGYLVVSGKAEVAPFLALLTSMATVAVSLVSGLAGHAAGAGAAEPPILVVPKASTPAGLPGAPTAPGTEAAAAGTALVPPAMGLQ